MSVLGPSQKRIDPEERRMIDQAVAAGKVKKIPMGVRSTGCGSAFDYKYSAKENRIQTISKDNGKPLKMRDAYRVVAGVPARHKIAYDRRAKVKRMLQDGKLTYQQIADNLGVSRQTIDRDVAILRGKKV